jgi:hypothetical protein
MAVHRLNPQQFKLAVGDIVEHPSTPGETAQVTEVGKRYFKAVTESGEKLGDTGIGLLDHRRMSKG